MKAMAVTQWSEDKDRSVFRSADGTRDILGTPSPILNDGSSSATSVFPNVYITVPATNSSAGKDTTGPNRPTRLALGTSVEEISLPLDSEFDASSIAHAQFDPEMGEPIILYIMSNHPVEFVLNLGTLDGPQTELPIQQRVSAHPVFKNPTRGVFPSDDICKVAAENTTKSGWYGYMESTKTHLWAEFLLSIHSIFNGLSQTYSIADITHDITASATAIPTTILTPFDVQTVPLHPVVSQAFLTFRGAIITVTKPQSPPPSPSKTLDAPYPTERTHPIGATASSAGNEKPATPSIWTTTALVCLASLFFLLFCLFLLILFERCYTRQ
ncbi:hypothetical protein GGR54DRAFT_589730 [Hypoxylon sp. NC1633]|nr:hypothetical protein GGR54DRAFT_589730 [Hypoxylon sp. NC1633]